MGVMTLEDLGLRPLEDPDIEYLENQYGEDEADVVIEQFNKTLKEYNSALDRYQVLLGISQTMREISVEQADPVSLKVVKRLLSKHEIELPLSLEHHSLGYGWIYCQEEAEEEAEKTKGWLTKLKEWLSKLVDKVVGIFKKTEKKTMDKIKYLEEKFQKTDFVKKETPRDKRVKFFKSFMVPTETEKASIGTISRAFYDNRGFKEEPLKNYYIALRDLVTGKSTSAPAELTLQSIGLKPDPRFLEKCKTNDLNIIETTAHFINVKCLQLVEEDIGSKKLRYIIYKTPQDKHPLKKYEPTDDELEAIDGFAAEKAELGRSLEMMKEVAEALTKNMDSLPKLKSTFDNAEPPSDETAAKAFTAVNKRAAGSLSSLLGWVQDTDKGVNGLLGLINDLLEASEGKTSNDDSNNSNDSDKDKEENKSSDSEGENKESEEKKD